MVEWSTLGSRAMREYPSVVTTVMPVVENLWNGVGITHANATGTFYGSGPGHAHTSITLDQDFVALRVAAKQWLPPRPHPSRPHDPKRGWTLDDPIGRLMKFQLHKFERLEAGSAISAAQYEHDDESPSVPPVTPTKKLAGKRPRANAEASSSSRCETGYREAELQQQLAVAHAEPPALEKLSLRETRILKRELQSALVRCQLHEEKLESAERECVICCNGTKVVAFVPCGHLASCVACSQHEQIQCCPICQAPIERRIRIFEV